MRFKKLDLNLLVALDVLLTERNVTRAGERIFLSQSSMSNALGRLRQYFNDELLVPVGGKLERTPRAELLHQAVRDVLLRIDTTIAAQPEFDPAASDREFSILVSDFSMATLIPHAVAITRSRGGTVRFSLQLQVAQPERALERGEADLLIIPKVFCSVDHPTETLFEEEFVCVVWNESQWASRDLTFDAYVAAGHVAMKPPGTGKHPAFETWFMERYGVSRRVEVTTYSFLCAPFLVVGTQHIATVHARLARSVEKSLPVTLLPFPIPAPKMEQCLQWHKYRTQDPGLVWLRALMHEAVERMDGHASA